MSNNKFLDFLKLIFPLRKLFFLKRYDVLIHPGGYRIVSDVIDMKMTEVPFLIGHQFFQATQELGRLAAFNPLAHIGHLVDKAGRCRMGDDVIDGEIIGRQVLGSIVEVFFRCLFLGPPGHARPAHGLVRRFDTAEGKKGLAFDGEDFTTQQVVEIGTQFMNPAAGPIFHRIATELVKVFMVPVDEQDRIRQLGQPFQPLMICFIRFADPGNPEIATNDDIIFEIHMNPTLGQCIHTQPFRIGMNVTSNINHSITSVCLYYTGLPQNKK